MEKDRTTTMSFGDYSGLFAYWDLGFVFWVGAQKML